VRFYKYHAASWRIPLTKIHLFMVLEVMPVMHLGVGVEVDLHYGAIAIDVPCLYLIGGWSSRSYPYGDSKS